MPVYRSFTSCGDGAEPGVAYRNPPDALPTNRGFEKTTIVSSGLESNAAQNFRTVGDGDAGRSYHFQKPERVKARPKAPSAHANHGRLDEKAASTIGAAAACETGAVTGGKERYRYESRYVPLGRKTSTGSVAPSPW
jgi:hypothetical protein